MAIHISYFDVIDRQTTISKSVFCIQTQYKKIPYLDTVYMVAQKPQNLHICHPFVMVPPEYVIKNQGSDYFFFKLYFPITTCVLQHSKICDRYDFIHILIMNVDCNIPKLMIQFQCLILYFSITNHFYVFRGEKDIHFVTLYEVFTLGNLKVSCDHCQLLRKICQLG